MVVAALVLIYAVIGFLIVPAVARSQAVSFLKDTYGLDLAIGELRFNPFTFTARVEQVSLNAPGGDRLLAFDAFSADFELRSLLERAVVFKSITLTQPYVHAHLRADGTLNLAQAFAGSHEPKAEEAGEQKTAGDKQGSAAPGIIIDDLTLSGGDIHFTDNAQGRDFDQHFTPLALHVQHFSTRPEDRSDLVGLDVRIGEQGHVTIAGDLSAIPTRFDVRLTGQTLPLAILQPYLAGRLPAEIGAGILSFDLALAQGQPGQKAELTLSGQATIAGLAVKLKGRDDLVLAWEEVTARGIGLDLAPDRLAIDEIAVKGLATSFRIYSDGRTNIGEILQQASADRPADAAPAQKTGTAPAPSAGAADGGAFPYAIGRVTVSDSRLLYGDEQIRPHVLVQIDQFAGEIAQVASAPETRTTLAFTGRVGEYGKADISGAARLAAPKQDLKAKVTFNNVELTSFSPYAGKFAGYTIDKGKLFLDLRYTLNKGRIKGENHAVFDQFELGAKVASEDATHLPVKFALSLLRDRAGRIDIDLPVEGDADAPGFRFGPLIVKALVNLITRIVTAPFDFIAGLFGGGPDMEYAVFTAGSAALPAAEHDKILPLSKALAARPRLVVEVQGWADPAADGGALKQRKLDDLLAAVAGSHGDGGQKPVESGDGLINPSPSVAEAYDAFFGAGSAAAVRAGLAAAAGSPANDGSANPTPPAVDPAAYEAELHARLLAAQPVSDEELVALAYARGQQVMDALVRDGGVEAERIFVRRGEIARADEGTRAKLILDAR
jgi:hypothetical protein